MNTEDVVKRLEEIQDPESLKGMSGFGINPEKAYGIKIPLLRSLAKEIRKNHELALQLWTVDYRETRIVATLIADPRRVGADLMESWVLDFYDWEICDQCCANLFEKTVHAWDKAVEWSARPEEFVKRAGFVLMARKAVADKRAPEELFYDFFPIIIRESADERNFVKKAVNWALRQIGKRSLALHERALAAARDIQALDSKAAHWIASDAIRELDNPKTIEYIKTHRSSIQPG